MNVLFIHRRLPAQFKHLISFFSSSSQNQVFGISQDDAPICQDNELARVYCKHYEPPHEKSPNIHPFAADFELCVKNGLAVAAILTRYKNQGIHFDIAFAHLGWGEALYFKDVYPLVPLIGYSEYYYHSQGTDVDFDPQYPISLEHQYKVRTLNAQLLLGMIASDVCVLPTCWQKSLFPQELHSKIKIIHEGIDINNIQPEKDAMLILPDGTALTKQDEVVSYSARNLEPYRGFHVLMRAVSEINKRRPNCHIIITGGDEVSYGVKLSNGLSYREQLSREINVDPNRVHFLGFVDYSLHLKILQISSAHIYLTYPFVLSWSFMEALASACVVIASNTAPVLEVIKHEHNGLLVDFFDHLQIADQVDRIFSDPMRFRAIAQNARATIVQHYDLQNSIAQYQYLIENLTSYSGVA